MNATLERASRLLHRGYAVIDVPFRSKKPSDREGWQNERWTAEELPSRFNGVPKNIGVLVGTPSGGSVDVDLDAPEALALADLILPPTDARFGRSSKPNSHRIYRADPTPEAVERFKDVDAKRTTLVELRSDGGQTLFPGSVHPSGEPIEWVREGEPEAIDGRVLRAHVAKLAAGALIARHWPPRPAPNESGTRHDLSLALAGGLLRAGWTEDDACEYITAVARVAGDEEAGARGANVRTTARRLGGNEPKKATGWPTFAKLIGQDVADKVCEWLGIERAGPDFVFDEEFIPPSKNGHASPAGAGEVPWPDPERRLDLPAAPSLDLSLFPPEVANVALDAAERLQCPPDYVAWGLTVCLAGLIGRGVGIRPRQFDDWTERACLWVALVGEPSWMKSPALEVARRPLKRQDALDHERHEYEMAAWEAECDEIRAAAKKGEKPKLPPKPVEVRRVTSDATIEKLADLMAPSPGLTLIRDEIAGWVGAFNRYTKAEGDRQFFLECYSGGPYTVDRISRGTVRVPDVYLNILGGAQPDRAREIFGEGPNDGFAARVTAVYPDLPPTWNEVDRWPDRPARVALDAVCDRLVAADWSALLPPDDWKPLPYCRPDREAGGLWSEWHTSVMVALRAGRWEGRHAGRVGKYPGLAARLALGWHFVGWAAGRVADDALARVPALTMASVLDLMDGYVRPMDDRVYRAFDRTAAATGAERIARWILATRPESFTLRDVRRHEWSDLTDPVAVAAAVEWLAAKGWVREADPEQRLGRPANRYLVNPRVWEGRA